ncbi:MAG: histidine phosphatase family protein [Planctomycetota bacterium]
MVRLILIRHGETNFSSQNRYCGFSNPPLNNKGIRQSEKLAVRLKDTKIDKVYSSDLIRAYQTAKIIFGDNPIEKTPDLREMNFGLFEGLKYEQLVGKYPELYRDWVDNPEKIKTPNGEGLRDLSKRVEEKLSIIVSQHKDKTLAVVAHGGPIRVVLCKALNFDLKIFWQIEQRLGALNIIDYSEESPPIVVKMNDVSHFSAKEKVTL